MCLECDTLYYRLVAATGAGCCQSDPQFRHWCIYHEGMADGIEKALNAVCTIGHSREESWNNEDLY